MKENIYDFEKHRKVFTPPIKSLHWDEKVFLENAYIYWDEYKNNPDRESIIYSTIVKVYESQMRYALSPPSCSVIEHGGRFGEQYINAISIRKLPNLSWKILEIPNIVEAGRADFIKKYPITYHNSIYDLRKSANIVCTSATFPYVESNWENFIMRMGNLSTQFVVFNKTPTTLNNDRTHWFMHSGIPYTVLFIKDAIDILEDFKLVSNEPHPKGHLGIHPGRYTNLVFARK